MAKKIGYHNLIINVATGTGTQATIAVYEAGTETGATLYADDIGTAKDNPFTTDSVGRFSFFANPGEYDIEVSGTGITTYKLEGISVIGEDSQFVKSAPTSGEHRIKKLRLDTTHNILVTYDGTPES